MPEDHLQIRFEDGAGYEKMMGTWSRMVGEVFLDWLALPPGLAWVDVGCGNGAFTQLLVDRCRPASVDGFDPSEAQLDFARSRPAGKVARFKQGDAMAAPYADRSFDSAVMALVLFFVPEPARGLAEMIRVTKPGGMVSAYCWDIFGGVEGFPLGGLTQGIRDMGLNPVYPPSAEISRVNAMRDLWRSAGLQDVEERTITVSRTFDSFDELWSVSILGSTVKTRLASMTPAQVEELKKRVSDFYPAGADGRITYSSRANAVKGRLAA